MELSIKFKSIAKKVLNIAFWVLLALIFIYALMAIFSKQENNRMSFFGITSLSVQSDSMVPTFDEGDLIFVKSNFDPHELEVGDVVTYEDYMVTDEGTIDYYNTHRITDIDKSSDTWRFTTQGDNVDQPDSRQILESEIVAVWTGTAWGGFGSFADSMIGFVKSPTGFFIVLVIPAVAFLVYEVIRFVKIYAEYNEQKHAHERVMSHEQAIAAAKEQLRKEAMEEAKRQSEEEKKAKAGESKAGDEEKS